MRLMSVRGMLRIKALRDDETARSRSTELSKKNRAPSICKAMSSRMEVKLQDIEITKIERANHFKHRINGESSLEIGLASSESFLMRSLEFTAPPFHHDSLILA